MTNHQHRFTRKPLETAKSTLLQRMQQIVFKKCLLHFSSVLLFSFGLGNDMAWGQSLGAYPAGTVMAGQNTPVTSSIENFNGAGNFTSNWGIVPFILFIIALKYIVQEDKPKSGSVSQKLSSNNENQIKQIGLAAAN
jgi:hypothetical protein